MKDMLPDGQWEESSSKQDKVIEENLDKSAADLNVSRQINQNFRHPTLRNSSSSKCRQCGGVSLTQISHAQWQVKPAIGVAE